MPDDGNRYEVIGGVLELMSPSPTAGHQSILSELIDALRQSCKTDYLIYFAPLDVILSDTNAVQPDAMMIRRSRKSIVTSRGVEGPPDLVAEVLSPGSRKKDRLKKMAVYEKHGVPEYWIVDPETRTLEQYRLNGLERLETDRIVRRRRVGRLKQAPLRLLLGQPPFYRRAAMTREASAPSIIRSGK
jgi:Uncharacterized protein conserved in cyanobacteria